MTKYRITFRDINRPDHIIEAAYHEFFEQWARFCDDDDTELALIAADAILAIEVVTA